MTRALTAALVISGLHAQLRSLYPLWKGAGAQPDTCTRPSQSNKPAILRGETDEEDEATMRILKAGKREEDMYVMYDVGKANGGRNSARRRDLGKSGRDEDYQLLVGCHIAWKGHRESRVQAGLAGLDVPRNPLGTSPS